MLVELFNKSVYISAVNCAGICNRLASGSGTAQAVHTDGEEDRCGLRCDVKNIADNGIGSYFKAHIKQPFIHSAPSRKARRHMIYIT